MSEQEKEYRLNYKVTYTEQCINEYRLLELETKIEAIISLLNTDKFDDIYKSIRKSKEVKYKRLEEIIN